MFEPFLSYILCPLKPNLLINYSKLNKMERNGSYTKYILCRISHFYLKTVCKESKYEKRTLPQFASSVSPEAETEE